MSSLDIDLSTRQPKYSVKLTKPEIDRIVELASPASFCATLRVLRECCPWQYAGHVKGRIQPAFIRDKTVVTPLAQFFLARNTAPYRLELIETLQTEDDKLLEAFRKEAVRRGKRTYFLDVEGFIDKAFSSDLDRNHVFMKRIACAFRERVAYVKEALLLHPRDVEGLGQVDDSLLQYAQQIQDGARSVIERPEETAEVVEVFDPVPLDEVSCTESFEVAWVPMRVKRDERIVDDRVLVYRIGKRIKSASWFRSSP